MLSTYLCSSCIQCSSLHFFFLNKKINQSSGEQLYSLGSCLQFFYKLLPNFSDLINSDDCIEKITSKSIGLYPVFVFKKLIQWKKGLFLLKKWLIQVIITMIMFSRSSEKIFNQSRYTSYIYALATIIFLLFIKSTLSGAPNDVKTFVQH